MHHHEETELDRVCAMLRKNEEDSRIQMAYYERVLESEVFLLLDRECDGEQASPRTFELEGQKYVLVFDREERLAAFSGGDTGDESPFLALSGRALVQILAEQSLGLAINLDVEASQMLLPASVVEWLKGISQQTPQKSEQGLTEIRPPQRLPKDLIEALGRKLAMAQGLAQSAYLADVIYKQDAQATLLAIVGAPIHAHSALAQAMQEVMSFSSENILGFDVMFLNEDARLIERLERVAIRFDLPKSQPRPAPIAPGTDPKSPPKLR